MSCDTGLLASARKSDNVASDLRQAGLVADRYRAPGGWTVEVVHLTGTPDHHDGQWLRVKRYSSWVADVRTVGELEQWVALADLEPDGLGLRQLHLALGIDWPSAFTRGACRAPGGGNAGTWKLTVRPLSCLADCSSSHEAISLSYPISWRRSSASRRARSMRVVAGMPVRSRLGTRSAGCRTRPSPMTSTSRTGLGLLGHRRTMAACLQLPGRSSRPPPPDFVLDGVIACPGFLGGLAYLCGAVILVLRSVGTSARWTTGRPDANLDPAVLTTTHDYRSPACHGQVSYSIQAA